MFFIKALSAHDGDCFIISYGDKHSKKTNILIDGGRRKPIFKQLKKEFSEIESNEEYLDLLVVTHIDEDHIQGILKLFSSNEINKEIIKSILFNSRELISERFINQVQKDTNLLIDSNTNGEISYKQGESFLEHLVKLDLAPLDITSNSKGNTIELNQGRITILSPDESSLERLLKSWDTAIEKRDLNKKVSAPNTDYEHSIEDLVAREFIQDKSITNASSISFILEYKNKRILMLADSHPSVIESKLTDIFGVGVVIPFDLIKVSHHGSKANTSESLLKLIDCENFLISVNDENKHGFPHKETLSKIANINRDKEYQTNFYFNYPGVSKNIFTQQELELYHINCYERNQNNDVLEIDLWNLSKS